MDFYGNRMMYKTQKTGRIQRLREHAEQLLSQPDPPRSLFEAEPIPGTTNSDKLIKVREYLANAETELAKVDGAQNEKEVRDLLRTVAHWENRVTGVTGFCDGTS